MMQERLQKLIARAGLTSRRTAEDWIRQGRVTVNGLVAQLGASADPGIDRIEIDGRPLPGAGKRVYLLLHKPAGYVTTLDDPEGRPLVTDLLQGLDARVFPVGRLDFNTEGLLLLTNDGELTHRLTHPRHEVEKTYLVRVRGQLREEAVSRLRDGIELEDGATAPARVEHIRAGKGHTWFEISIHEGRNRQVRRMCEAIGYPVSRLKRIRFAFLGLNDLPLGRFRHLTGPEVERLKSL